MASPNGVAAVVLAGGTSSRMKQFKPLLPLCGRALVEHAIALFGECGAEVIVVLGHRAAELRPLVERAGARAVFNPHFEQGMYSSVFAGVQALGPEVRAAFVLPADLPAVRPGTVALLLRTWRQSGADVVYPAFRGERGHPPVISARVFPGVTSGDGRGGLRRVLAAHEARALEVGVLDEGVLLDLDAPGDYQRALLICGDRAVPTPEECEALLASLRVNRGVVVHGRAVARAAAWLGSRLGPPLDARLLAAAGLLHDLAKGAGDHARAAAGVLAGLGFPRVAVAVAAHMELPAGGAARLDEAALLYLADKLVRGERLVGIEERFRAAGERFHGDPAALLAAARRRADALAVASQVERRLGAGWWDELRRDCGEPAAATPRPAEEARDA